MNSFLWVIIIVLFIVAAWFAWRYYDLKRRVNEYARLTRISPERLPTDVKEIENLSNAIASLKTTFNLQLSTLEMTKTSASRSGEQLNRWRDHCGCERIYPICEPAAQKLLKFQM
jgi:predicted negative regulator of RcsB-dependent stress response